VPRLLFTYTNVQGDVIMKGSISLTWRKMPERYRLTGTRCSTCGTCYFPRRQICPKCRRKGKFEDVQFKGTGKILTYTQIHTPPTGFEEQAPYVMVIVELDEGARVTGQLVDSKYSNVKIGDRVRATFRVVQSDDPKGLVYYGFKFVRVDDDVGKKE